MAVNPVGLVQIFDYGAPKTITAKAGMAISGGYLIRVSGTANAVSSGADSFASSDLVAVAAASGTAFTGVALNNVASGTNNYVTIGLKGAYIIRAYDTVTVAQPVDCEGTHAVSAGVADGTIIGRALTSATSGNYALIDINA